MSDLNLEYLKEHANLLEGAAAIEKRKQLIDSLEKGELSIESLLSLRSLGMLGEELYQ